MHIFNNTLFNAITQVKEKQSDTTTATTSFEDLMYTKVPKNIDTIHVEEPLTQEEKNNNLRLLERSKKIQDFFDNDYSRFQEKLRKHWLNKNNPEYTLQGEFAPLISQTESASSRYVVIDGILEKLSSDELHILERLYVEKPIPDNSQKVQWLEQQLIRTEKNEFEEASLFKEFIQKQINQGVPEDSAIHKASMFVRAGLLDSGKQRVTYIENVGFDDKKEHGLHLVEDSVVNNSFQEMYNTLDSEELFLLHKDLFEDNYLKEPFPQTGIDESESQFEKFIKDMGLKGVLISPQNDDTNKMPSEILLTQFHSLDEKNEIYTKMAEHFKGIIKEYDRKIQTNIEEGKPPYASYVKHKEVLNKAIGILEKNAQEFNVQKLTELKVALQNLIYLQKSKQIYTPIEDAMISYLHFKEY